MNGRRARDDRTVPAVLWLFVAWTLATSLAGCRPAVSVAESGAGTDLDEVEGVRSQLVEAELRGDRSAQAALYAAHAVLLDPDGPVVEGRSEIRAGLEEFDVRLEEFSLTSIELEIVGELAWDRGRYALTFLDSVGGARVAETGQYLMVLRKREDRGWRIAALIYHALPSLGSTGSYAP